MGGVAGRTLVAATLAIGVNAALLVGLAWLNRPASVDAEPAQAMTVSLQPRTTPPPSRRTPTEPPPPTPQPPTPTAPRTPPPMPTPRLSEVPPLDIELSFDMPTMSPVQVAAQLASAPEAPADAAPSPPTPPSPPSQPARRQPAAPPTPAAPPAPMPMDQADQPPREKPGNPQPSYPATALRRGIEGSVRVKVRIDTRGRVQRVEVLEVDGHRAFGDAVLDVIRQWRFDPAVHRGQRVPVFGVKEIRFELRDTP